MNPFFSHIKMVAIDCDETLVRSDNTVSDYTVDVLHRLQQRGIVVTIATGRMYQTAKPIGQALKLGNVPMILFSGGLIQELETGCKLFEHSSTKRIIAPRRTAARRRPVQPRTCFAAPRGYRALRLR